VDLGILDPGDELATSAVHLDVRQDETIRLIGPTIHITYALNVPLLDSPT